MADPDPTPTRPCPTCGASVAAEHQSCTSCGTLLRAMGAGADPPRHEPVFSHEPWFTGAPPDARPVAPAPPTVVAPPPVVLPPPSAGRRRSSGDRVALGCGLALVVVAALLVGAVLIVKRAQRADDPAPLNTTSRTTVTTDGLTFTMDGTPVREKLLDWQTGGGGFLSWTTTHDGWQEWVGVFHETDGGGAVDLYDQQAPHLGSTLFGRGTIDEERTEQVEGRAATWFRGHGESLRGGRPISGTWVDRAGIEYLVTTVDDANLVVIGIEWDPKHPPPSEEIEEVRRSFKVRR